MFVSWVGFFLYYVGYLVGLWKFGKLIGCVYVVMDIVFVDGIVGWGGQNYREIDVVFWSVVLRVLVLVVGIVGVYVVELIDINCVDVQVLQQGLMMVGVVKVEVIVEYWCRYGLFYCVEDLVQVKGIGKVIVEWN